MANRVNRYSTLYQSMVRSNVASTFPRHVFIRAANLESNHVDRVGNRYLY